MRRLPPSYYSLPNLSRLLVALAFALWPWSVQGQVRNGQKTSPKKVREDAQTLRSRAINLLIQTAEEARSFSDLLYRARVQMLAADELWPFVTQGS